MAYSYAPLNGLLSALRWLYVLVVIGAVLPHGSTGELAYFTTTFLVGSLFLACMFIAPVNPRVSGTANLTLAMMLLCGAYLGFQVLPLPGLAFSNPAWTDVISAGLAERVGFISVAPANTLAAAPALLMPFAVFYMGLVLHPDDTSARQLWSRLALMSGLVMIVSLVRHEFYPDAALFGVPARDDNSLHGPIFNRNVAAAFFVLSSFAAAGLIGIQLAQTSIESLLRRLPQANFFSERKYLLLVAGLLLFLLGMVTVLLTRSRAGVAFGLGSITLAIMWALLSARWSSRYVHWRWRAALADPPPLNWSAVMIRKTEDWSSPRFWSVLHATFRVSFSWAAKALGVKFPSDECGLVSL